MTDNLLLTTIYDSLMEAGIKKEIAIKSLRAFCRKYGGQKIFFSPNPQSKRANEIFNLISEALDIRDDNYALPEKITKVFLSEFYNIGEYIPLEFNAFRDEIALEISKEYAEAKDKNEALIKICQRYNMSFVTFFKIRRDLKNKKIKNQKNPNLF